MAKNIIGLDIGGTKITGIVFEGKKIKRALTIATPKNLKDFQYSLRKLVRFLSAGESIYGLGIGQPGVVNPKTGLSSGASNMKFLSGHNQKKFYNSLGMKYVKIDNDAHCFALAEAVLGKGKSFKNFVGLTLGTGIGGGIVINKQLYSGSHKSAGHLGHIMEDLKYDSEHYFQIYRDRKDFKKLGQTVGILFANIMNALDVDAIILGGSVSLTSHRKFLPLALKLAKRHVVNNQTMPKVLISSLKHSGAIGAALLVQNN